ncbi:MAG: DUF3450 domain-containing protein [Prevotella sp.]|jgi:hypothetical protein|nr:DUF3450 domain-containing protein [Prevotella sp.]
MQEKKKEISIVKKRFLQYLDYKGITKYKCYQETGIANGVFSQRGGLSEEITLKLISYYSDLNPDWLFSGQGMMIKDESKMLAIRLYDKCEALTHENGKLSEKVVQLTESKHDLKARVEQLTKKVEELESQVRKNSQLAGKVESLTKEKAELEKNSNWGKEPHPSFLSLAGLDGREEVEVLARTEGVDTMRDAF